MNMEQDIKRMLWVISIAIFAALWIVFNDPEYFTASLKYIVFIAALMVIIVNRKHIGFR